MATWKDVDRIALALPEVVAGTRSQRDWRIRDKAIAWERPLRKGDLEALGDAAPTGDILAARVPDEGAKQALLADDPAIYFTTPHFDGYPAILVRLRQIRVAELRELLTEAWLCRAPKRLVKEFRPGS
jgi:hypothetical protein